MDVLVSLSNDLASWLRTSPVGKSILVVTGVIITFNLLHAIWDWARQVLLKDDRAYPTPAVSPAVGSGYWGYERTIPLPPPALQASNSPAYGTSPTTAGAGTGRRRRKRRRRRSTTEPPSHSYDRPGRGLSDSQQNPIFEDTLDEVFGSRRSAFERDQSFGKHGYQPPADHICYEDIWELLSKDGCLGVIIPREETITIIKGDDGTVTIDPLSMAKRLREAEEAGMIVDVQPFGDDEFVVRVYRPGPGI